MSTIKLTYFDIDGGRAEPVRLALSIAGIAFEDQRINFQQFHEIKESLPLGCVPVIEIDGKHYTQCNAMNRYFGKKAGLYPDDPWQAFLCDEILELLEDASNALGKTFGLEAEALKQARENVAAGIFTKLLKLLSERLEDAGGHYFAGGKLSMADLKVFEWVRILQSGMFDHIPQDLVQQQAPSLLAHQERVANDAGVSAYYAKRQQASA